MNKMIALITLILAMMLLASAHAGGVKVEIIECHKSDKNEKEVVCTVKRCLDDACKNFNQAEEVISIKDLKLKLEEIGKQIQGKQEEADGVQSMIDQAANLGVVE